jgi:outer membrane protein TolC
MSRKTLLDKKVLFLSFITCLLFSSCRVSNTGGFDNYVGPRDANKKPPSQEQVKAKPPEGPLQVSVKEAVFLALDNNHSLKLERLTPAVRQTAEEQQRAVFDPTIGAQLSNSRQRTHNEATDARSQSTDASADISKLFPTGTQVSGAVTASRSKSAPSGDSYETDAGLTVTQALLQGRGVQVNLASLKQAQLDTKASEYELRGFAESLVAQVEESFWDYALAKRQIDIYTSSLKLAEQYLAETEERIKVGKLAEAELAAAQAEVASRQQDLINARSNLEKTRLKLLQLLNPPGADLWNRGVVLKDEPLVPEEKLDDVESHVKVALQMRTDLKQARLLFQRDELEVVKTKNGLLPKLDFFITLGRSGYADSFGASVENLGGASYDFSAGLKLDYALGNRAANATHEQALLTREQARESLENLALLVQVDVRSAYIEVNRTKEQISATASTRKFKEETLRWETEKFRVGKSTTFLVAQAQRDLVTSQVAEIQAVVNYLKALVELFRLEGSLLERRGISAPGREPSPEP